jgi:hypothetical protein
MKSQLKDILWLFPWHTEMFDCHLLDEKTESDLASKPEEAECCYPALRLFPGMHPKKIVCPT